MSSEFQQDCETLNKICKEHIRFKKALKKIMIHGYQRLANPEYCAVLADEALNPPKNNMAHLRWTPSVEVKNGKSK